MDHLFRARDPTPAERMSANELCERCGISQNRLRYLKDLGLVSGAIGSGGNSHYTEKHESEVKMAASLGREFGSLAKARKLARQASPPCDVPSQSTDEFSFRTERVYQLWSGIRIVVPEVLGENGTAQLTRILKAAQDSKFREHERHFESAFSLLEESERRKARPKTKAKAKPPSPLPSA